MENIISRLSKLSVHRNHPREVKQSVNALKGSLTKLRERRDDVKEKVDIAESNPSEPVKHTHEVSNWLHRAETLERDVESILQDEEGAGRSGHQFEKLVVEKSKAVEELLNGGAFQVFVERSQSDIVTDIDANETLQLFPNLEKVMSLLIDKEIIGVYGMGGVGKTTLLHIVNNECRRRGQFDLVIFVVVSRDLNLKSIQNQIGKRLGVSWMEETETHKRARDIFKMLKKRNFLLLLDDIWERVDLLKVGVPVKLTTHERTKSRVIFTTRSESVCGYMQADAIHKVNCLDWDSSWRLFQQSVGRQALYWDPNLFELAKQVARECLGLPLALISTARTMANRTTLQQWQYAINVRQKSASQFPDVADKVLAILKFSYDDLPDEKLKACFLHCSLYPEDYSIRKVELIRLWIGEGFLDKVDIDEAYKEGHDVIESLKSACLLENGNNRKGIDVKMHDVVRDLAIWITSDLGRQEGRYLTVQAENKLELHEWKKAEKISLVNNVAIKELNGAPNWTNVSTLLLHNSKVKTISDAFFQSMPKLKVLDMSDSMLKKLPASIFSLTELQYLDLSRDNMAGFDAIILGPGTLTCLKKLKMLDLFDSGINNWEVVGGPSLGELECLKDLNYLGISLKTVHALQRLVSSPKLQLCTKLLQIHKCQDITTLVLTPPSLTTSPISSSVCLANMVSLKTLQLVRCLELVELRVISLIGMENEPAWFTALERLKIKEMPKLKIVWDVPQRSTFCLVNLKNVSIRKCPNLKDVTWLIYAPNLETLNLHNLEELEEVISDKFAGKINVFSRLKYLKLDMLMNLKKICNYNVKFSALKSIMVKTCPQLMKLPFEINTVIPNTPPSIEGMRKWWERLEWEDETTKSNFAPYFVELRA